MDENYIAPIMAHSPHLVAKVWRGISDLDVDRNGFLSVDELQGCFNEQFPVALDGKSLVYFFRRWSTDHDKDLVNYRLIKQTIMSVINKFKTPVKSLD